MKIVIAGGTGFIGKKLISQLIVAGDDVTILTRLPAETKALRPKEIQWDGKSQGSWSQEIDGADVVINLSGEGIANKKWSENQKALLRSSRLAPTQALVQAVGSARIKPKTFINVSAVGYYGNILEGEVDESFPKGEGFLADLCADWEAAAKKVEAFGVRLVLPRIGIVLGENQGALKKMIPPFKFYLGGSIGSGKQWFPWVHVEDVVGLILFSIKNESIVGPLNVCSPHPVRMNEFCKTLGHVLKRPSWLPVFPWILRCILGEMAEMLLGGQCAVPRKALQAGFKFRFTSLESALTGLF